MLLVIEDAIVTQSYYSEKSGTLFFSLTDRDTGAALDLTSEHMEAHETQRVVDQRVKAELKIKIAKFQGNPRLVVLAARFSPVAATQPEAVKKPA